MKRNRIVYFTLLTLSIVFIYFNGGKVPYMFFYVTLSLPVVSFLYILIINYRFKYSQDIDKKHVIKGEKVNFKFSINNEDFFLYPYIRVVFSGADTVFAQQFQSKSFSLAPNRKTSFSFELECLYRGFYDIGIDSVELEDFLGIFRLTYRMNEIRHLTVYPKIIYLDKFKLQANYLSDTHAALNTKLEDITTISDMRKYKPGDGLKRVHWKLSAKMNELMSKNFQSTSQTDSIIFLDLQQSTLPLGTRVILEDKLIESVVAVIYYCLSNWIPIQFVYFENEIVNIDACNPLEFDELYRILSRVAFNESVDIKDLLDVYLKDNLKQTNIFVFTSNVNYELYDQIYKAVLSGNVVSLIYVSPEELTGIKSEDVENILSYLPEIGVNIYRLNINDNIKLVLER